MKRSDVARFIESQFENGNCDREKSEKHHYGWQELRELMDFIYMSEPLSPEEMLNNECKYRKKR
jgi:hypothetical protein